MNRRVVIKAVPVGEPKPSDFELIAEPVPVLTDGEMLLRTRWLSLDPYMRTPEGMANPRRVGRTMLGGTVSEVMGSRAPGWSAGDLVVGYYGWQEYAIGRPSDVQWRMKQWAVEKWDARLGEESNALSVLGMPGFTAYFGLMERGRPRPGETVVVSAASGAVGSLVGQLAKALGCRVVGVAGGARKCSYCVGELSFDACVDYRSQGFREALAAACPHGVDVYFENVGGDVLEAVIPLLNEACRVPICGFISQYNSMGDPAGATSLKTPMQRLKEVGLPLFGQGGDSSGYGFFGFVEFLPRFLEAREFLAKLVREGKLKTRHSVSEGLESSVDAFIGMLRGNNFGKTLVKVS